MINQRGRTNSRRHHNAHHRPSVHRKAMDGRGAVDDTCIPITSSWVYLHTGDHPRPQIGLKRVLQSACMGGVSVV